MTKELKEITAELEKLEARRLEIRSEAETADAETLEKLNSELDASDARMAELNEKKAEIEKRQAEAAAIEAGEVKAEKIELPPENTVRENKVMGRNSVEYRNAFYAYLVGNESAEQRDALITTANGVALPKELDDQIWNNIHSEHPILADIDIKNTGVVLEVSKHTAITAGKAKKVAEGVANDDEANTFVTVTLSGNDYSKSVELSYAEAKMTQGALEDYLATEISADLGEVLASDVFAQIAADAGTTNTVSAIDFTALKTALGAVRGNGVTIYASRAVKFTNIVGLVDTAKQPIFRDGVVLGSDVKEDDAAGADIYIVAPKMFVLNMIQPIMIETDRDIKAHKIIYSGYCRAQGTMRDSRAAAVLKISAT